MFELITLKNASTALTNGKIVEKLYYLQQFKLLFGYWSTLTNHLHSLTSAK